MIGRTNLASKGGVDIQGVIKKYIAYAGENISIGDFVEILNTSIDTQLNSSANGNKVSAVALSETKVFIVHNSSSYIYGIVCTIENGNITVGTDTQICSVGDDSFSLTKLNENKVFIAHNSNEYGYTYSLCGIVCTISGTAITAGTDIELSSTSRSGVYNSAVALNENKVFIAHSGYGSNFYLYGMVCTISGTAITAETDIELSNQALSGYSISAVLLSENKVVIAHSYSSSQRLYCMAITISGTTITAGTDVQLYSNSYSSAFLSIATLNENKVFIVHTSDQSNYYLCGIVCTISGTAITAGTDTQLSGVVGTANFGTSAVALNENKVFIVHNSDQSNRYLKGMVCTISGTAITAETDTTLSSVNNSGQYISMTLMICPFIVCNGQNAYIHGLLYGEFEKKVTSTLQTIGGIAKTSGIGFNTIETYTPNYN